MNLPDEVERKIEEIALRRASWEGQYFGKIGAREMAEWLMEEVCPWCGLADHGDGGWCNELGTYGHSKDYWSTRAEWLRRKR